MGFWDTLTSSPGTPEGAQISGLLGGLSALGATLAAAGARRPVGQPAPSLADAFTAFGPGQRQGLLAAREQANTAREAKKQGLLDAARGPLPDEQLPKEALALRQTLSALPEGVRGLSGLLDMGQLTGVALNRETNRQRPMTPEEAQQLNLRPGTVSYVNDFTGAPSILQQPDTKSPEAMRQAFQLAAAGRAPQVTWRTVTDAAGNVIAKVGSNGDYVPLRQQSEGFTLGEGQKRYGPDGRLIAEGGPPKPNLPVGMMLDPVTGQAVPIPGVPEYQAKVAADDPKAKAAMADNLRGEFTKATGDFRTVQDAFNKIKEAGTTGQGDMALLYGYMKILDPGSVVRESEFESAARSGSLPQRVQGWASRLISGEKLPDEVRKAFIVEAANVYRAQVAGYQNLANTYTDLAKRNNVDPANVVVPFKFTDVPAPGAPGGGGGPLPDPAGIRGGRR